MELTKPVNDFVVDEAAYEKFKAIILEAKSLEKVEVFRKPTRASGLSEKDARMHLQFANDTFECEEWFEAERLYHELNELKVGPKSIASKLSLCLTLTERCDDAFPLAKKAIVETPLDANAYISLALLKNEVGCYLESERLLQLAELTSNPNADLITQTRNCNIVDAEIRKREAAAFRHLIKFNPDFIETYKAINEADDKDPILHLLIRAKENPDCLEEMARSNPEFRCALAGNWALPEAFAPRRFDDQSTRQFAQPDCPIHTVNSSVFLAILKYLCIDELIALRRTCRYLEYLGLFPKNYKLMLTNMGVGPPDLPDRRGNDDHSYHDAVNSVLSIRVFFPLYLEVSKSNFEKEATRKLYSEKIGDFFTNARFLYSYYGPLSCAYWRLLSSCCEDWSPEYDFAKYLALRSDTWEVLECAFFNPTEYYLESFPSLVGLFLSLVVLGKAKGPFPASMVNRFWSMLESGVHKETCAALAVCCNASRLSEMNLTTVCEQIYSIRDEPDDDVRSTRFFLDGIWQGVQGYKSYLFKDLREECIMNLKFPSIVVGQVMGTEPTAFEMIGTGIDSFGEFELEDPIFDSWNLTITFTKVYRQTNQYHTPIKHYYVGVMYASGIGGYFGTTPDPDEDLESFIGFFFYGRPLACAETATGFLPFFRTTRHTATMSWDDLVPFISTRAEENAQLKRTLLLVHSGPATNLQFYELPGYVEASKFFDTARKSNFCLHIASIPSTTISTLMELVQRYESVTPGHFDIKMEKFPADSNKKWDLRCELLKIGWSLYQSVVFQILECDLTSLHQIGKTLEQFNFDPTKPEVKNAIEQFALISHSSRRKLSARLVYHIIQGLDKYHQSVPDDAAPDSVLSAADYIVRRSNRERKTSTTLIASAVAASALVLVGTVFVARYFLKQKSTKH